MLFLYARLVWALSPLAGCFYPSSSLSIYENLSVLLIPLENSENRATTDHMYHCWPWILWLIWKKHNDLVYNGVDCSLDNLLQQPMDEAEEWKQGNSSLNPSLPHVAPTRQCRKWTPPPDNYYKCNVDGGWKENSDKSGIGWILRNHLGCVRQLGVKCYPKLASPLELEAAALSWAVSCLSIQGIHNVIFESDCRDLIEAIKSPSLWPRLQSFTLEILGLCKEESNYSFRFVYREGNICAVQMAKHISLCPTYFALLDVTLPFLLNSCVEHDKTCTQDSSINQ